MKPWIILVAALLAQAQDYDLILRNGTIIDGTGAKAYKADLAIRGKYIVKIGAIPNAAKAANVIDARNLVVAPGFINLHSHATPTGVRTAANMLTQGVTTEIVNADGSGTLDGLAAFTTQGLAVNLGGYIGFNTAWATVVGRTDRRPTPDELEKMKTILTANLEKGAWGVSAGLDYKPGYFAKTSEVIAILEAARPWRTNFPNHDRLTPENKFSSLAGHAETIEIASKAGALPVVTHMKVQGYEQGSGAKAVAALRQAGAVADVYPYLAGQTGLGSLFVPAWAVEGTRDDMLKRFRDPALRPRIAQEIEAAIKARILTPDNIDIPSKGRRFADYMKEMNAGAGETMLRILEQEQPSAILKFGDERDLVELMRYEGTAISCDCGASDVVPGMHPRYFGTFPRVLGHYVRETHDLTLEDAVRKMTGLPASIIGLVDRGLLAPGMIADVTIFDPAGVIDHATYEKPTQGSDGVRHVLVNGQFALQDGKLTNAKSGVLLKRSAHMPSRVMSLNKPRSVQAAGKDFALRLEQGIHDRNAQGTFKLGDITLTAAGTLQTAQNWASFTGMSANQPVLVIVDGSNLLNPQPSIHVEVGGSRIVESTPAKMRVN